MPIWCLQVRKLVKCILSPGIEGISPAFWEEFPIAMLDYQRTIFHEIQKKNTSSIQVNDAYIMLICYISIFRSFNMSKRQILAIEAIGATLL